jgi:hypothetical protein
MPLQNTRLLSSSQDEFNDQLQQQLIKFNNLLQNYSSALEENEALKAQLQDQTEKSAAEIKQLSLKLNVFKSKCEQTKLQEQVLA